MRTVTAVHLDDGSFIAIPVGVVRWASQCFLPVRSEALRVLRVIAVTESMTNYFVPQYPNVPGVRQLQ